MRVFLIVGGVVLVLTIVVLAVKKAASGTNTNPGDGSLLTSSALLTASPSDLVQPIAGNEFLGFTTLGKPTFKALPRTVVQASAGPASEGTSGRSHF